MAIKELEYLQFSPDGDKYHVAPGGYGLGEGPLKILMTNKIYRADNDVISLDHVKVSWRVYGKNAEGKTFSRRSQDLGGNFNSSLIPGNQQDLIRITEPDTWQLKTWTRLPKTPEGEDPKQMKLNLHNWISTNEITHITYLEILIELYNCYGDLQIQQFKVFNGDKLYDLDDQAPFEKLFSKGPESKAGLYEGCYANGFSLELKENDEEHKILTISSDEYENNAKIAYTKYSDEDPLEIIRDENGAITNVDFGFFFWYNFKIHRYQWTLGYMSKEMHCENRIYAVPCHFSIDDKISFSRGILKHYYSEYHGYEYEELIGFVDGTNRIQLYRTRLQGWEANQDRRWNEWQYENPPANPGVEYKTTEKFFNAPVYTKTIIIKCTGETFPTSETADPQRTIVYTLLGDAIQQPLSEDFKPNTYNVLSADISFDSKETRAFKNSSNEWTHWKSSEVQRAIPVSSFSRYNSGSLPGEIYPYHYAFSNLQFIIAPTPYNNKSSNQKFNGICLWVTRSSSTFAPTKLGESESDPAYIFVTLKYTKDLITGTFSENSNILEENDE